MKKKEKIIGILFIVAALIIGGVFLYQHFFATPKKVVTVKEENKNTIEKVEDEQEIESEFIMKNITDEQLEPFRTDVNELAQMLKDWCLKNGNYKIVIGMEFYSDEIMVTEEKCSVMMKTIMPEGIAEEANMILVLDYNPISNRYNFHP